MTLPEFPMQKNSLKRRRCLWAPKILPSWSISFSILRISELTTITWDTPKEMNFSLNWRKVLLRYLIRTSTEECRMTTSWFLQGSKDLKTESNRWDRSWKKNPPRSSTSSLKSADTALQKVPIPEAISTEQDTPCTPSRITPTKTTSNTIRRCTMNSIFVSTP